MPSVKSQNDALDLSAKTAAVAGATQGIGAGIAVRFAALGANVLIVGRNAERAKQVLQECRDAARGSSETRIFDFVQADLRSVFYHCDPRNFLAPCVPYSLVWDIS
jgi:NAD(P)-dependent dehydrogenase (short-subunit alcohol dehydrogenase family)